MRKISIVSLFLFLVCTVYNSPTSFAGGGMSVAPNAVKVECINITGRTSNKLIDICCIDGDFNLTEPLDCLGLEGPPFNPDNASRTCLSPFGGMYYLAFTPTFVCPSPCGGCPEP
jgi:hypothetical protein